MHVIFPPCTVNLTIEQTIAHRTERTLSFFLFLDIVTNDQYFVIIIIHKSRYYVLADIEISRKSRSGFSLVTQSSQDVILHNNKLAVNCTKPFRKKMKNTRLPAEVISLFLSLSPKYKILTSKHQIQKVKKKSIQWNF